MEVKLISSVTVSLHILKHTEHLGTHPHKGYSRVYVIPIGLRYISNDFPSMYRCIFTDLDVF